MVGQAEDLEEIIHFSNEPLNHSASPQNIRRLEMVYGFDTAQKMADAPISCSGTLILAHSRAHARSHTQALRQAQIQAGRQEGTKARMQAGTKVHAQAG